MTSETARQEIESLDYYLQNHTDDYSEESHRAMMMAIKALEQEPVLDKIMAEITERRDSITALIAYPPDVYNRCLSIIDKYRKSLEQ